MKKDRFTLLLGLLILPAFIGVNCFSQDNRGQQIVRLKGGGYVSFKTTTEPESTEEFSFSAAETDSNVIHRVLVDKTGKTYFGYDLEVEPVVETREFRVRVLPLSPAFEESLRARKNFTAGPIEADSKLSRISQSSTKELLKDGDAVALDVMFNPETHIKIVDLISVSYDDLSLRQDSVSHSPPRDYTLNDVELKMSNYRLLINGELVTSSRPTGGCAGPIIWFYIPGKGRFIFSMVQHDGYDFKKIGTIEQNKISFKIDSDKYEWVSSSPVIGTGGNWNLYVLHDPTYISEFAPDDERSFIGANLTPKDSQAPERSKKAAPKTLRTSTEAFNGSVALPDADPKRSTVSSVASKIGGVAAAPTRQLLRLIFGAADRIENLLPKN